MTSHECVYEIPVCVYDTIVLANKYVQDRSPTETVLRTCLVLTLLVRLANQYMLNWYFTNSVCKPLCDIKQ